MKIWKKLFGQPDPDTKAEPIAKITMDGREVHHEIKNQKPIVKVTPIEEMVANNNNCIKDHIKSFNEPGARLRWARMCRKLTQKQLADCIGMSRQLISDIETGKSQHTKVSHAKALAKALNVDIDLIWETIVNK